MVEYPSFCAIKCEKLGSLIVCLPSLMYMAIEKKEEEDMTIIDQNRRWRLSVNTRLMQDVGKEREELSYEFIFAPYGVEGIISTKVITVPTGEFWDHHKMRAYLEMLGEFELIYQRQAEVMFIEERLCETPYFKLPARDVFIPLYGILRWHIHMKKGTNDQWLYYFCDFMRAEYKIEFVGQRKRSSDVRWAVRIHVRFLHVNETYYTATHSMHACDYHTYKPFLIYVAWAYKQAEEFYKLDNQVNYLSSCVNKDLFDDSLNGEQFRDFLEQVFATCPDACLPPPLPPTSPSSSASFSPSSPPRDRLRCLSPVSVTEIDSPYSRLLHPNS